MQARKLEERGSGTCPHVHAGGRQRRRFGNEGGGRSRVVAASVQQFEHCPRLRHLEAAEAPCHARVVVAQLSERPAPTFHHQVTPRAFRSASRAGLLSVLYRITHCNEYSQLCHSTAG